MTAACSAIPTSKNAVGPALAERQQARRPGHGGRNGDHVVTLFCYFDHGFAEGQRVALDGPGRFGRAGGRVKSTSVVQAFFFVVFGRPVARALFGYDVHDDRPVVGGGLAESLFHAGDVVPVEGPDVANAQGLEKRRRLNDFSYRRIKTLQARIGQAPDSGQVPHCASIRRRAELTPGWSRIRVRLSESRDTVGA